MAARVAAVAVAVVVLAWLGLMTRDTHLAARGAAALEPGASAATLAAAESDLEAARTLNPDQQPSIDLALLRRARGDVPGAIATIQGVVRREPDNLVAWGVLSVLARGRPALVREAFAARARLDPLRARQAR